MPKYIVETLVAYTQIVEADSPQEAERKGYDWTELPENDGVDSIKVMEVINGMP